MNENNEKQAASCEKEPQAVGKRQASKGMWVLKERRHLHCRWWQKEGWCWRGSTRLYILYAEDIITRAMGRERWHHNHPMDMVSLQGALKDAL